MTHNLDAIQAGSINNLAEAGPQLPSAETAVVSHEFRGQRLADISLSFALIVVLFPVIIIRASYCAAYFPPPVSGEKRISGEY